MPQIGGDVRGRHVPQAQPGRPRLPAAERDGQPAAAGGRSSSTGSARPSTCRRPRATTSSAKVEGDVVEQIIRPTGLIDPEVVVKPTKGQIDDLIHEIRARTEKNERVLVTTLTKKMSEDLTDYLLDAGIRTRYLHSEVDTLAPDRAAARAAPGRVRRPGRHQPAPRGPRPARGVAGGDPRRRQGGLPALRQVADPDDRPRGPQRVRPGAHVRRQDHALDGEGDRRDQPAPRRSRSPTTRAHGVDPQPLRKKIADITEMLAREDEDTEELLGPGRHRPRGKRRRRRRRSPGLPSRTSRRARRRRWPACRPPTWPS